LAVAVKVARKEAKAGEEAGQFRVLAHCK
jgi:hypothetical protein